MECPLPSRNHERETLNTHRALNQELLARVTQKCLTARCLRSNLETQNNGVVHMR